MNPELYTDEFRDFKFLKSDARQINYYKNVANRLNQVQPWAQVNDPDFTWPCRLEFIEQLLDLTNDTIYIVEPGLLYNTHKDRFSYDFEQARINEIINPVVYKGQIVSPAAGQIAQISDIPEIEDSYNNLNWYLCSKEYFTAHPCHGLLFDGRIFTFAENPLVPSDYITYTAIFYDKEWATKYRDAITFFLRKNNDAISAISRLF